MDAVKKTHGVVWASNGIFHEERDGVGTYGQHWEMIHRRSACQEAKGWIYPDLCMFSSLDDRLMRYGYDSQDISITQESAT